jgi:hypothetical protein
MATYFAFYHSETPPFSATINFDVFIIARLNIVINFGKHLEHTFRRGLYKSTLKLHVLYTELLTWCSPSIGTVMPHILHRKVSPGGIIPNTPRSRQTPLL